MLATRMECFASCSCSSDGRCSWLLPHALPGRCTTSLSLGTGPYFSMQRLLGSIVLRSTGPPLMPSPPASLNAFFSGLSGCLHALWLSLRWSRTDSSHQSTLAACCSFFAAASESHEIVELFMLCCAVPGAAGMVLSTLSLQKKLFERLAPAAKQVLFDQVQCKDMNEQAQKELRKLQQIQVMMKMMAMLTCVFVAFWTFPPWSFLAMARSQRS
jgi:hypothetical protein